MKTLDKQHFICQKASERRVKWSRHALSELASEPVTVADVETALGQAEVIEDYPHLRRFLPDCLVLAYDTSGQPFHCVIAVDIPRDSILIVTIYSPTDKEWENDWRTRK